MNILVTGGYGFIGHNVVKRLRDLGHVVSIIDSETNYGVIPQIELNDLINLRQAKIGDAYRYYTDICDVKAVEKAFNIEQPEIVIHLASFPRQKVVANDPVDGSNVMTGGLLNLLQLSDRYEVRKFVYISSSMVYGDFKDNTTEDAPCNPHGVYGILKYTGELLVRDYSVRTPMTHTIIRPSAVYGELDVMDRVVAQFLLHAMRNEELNVNGATEALDFTYVDDIADGIVGAALSDNTDNKTYNITRGKRRTLLDAANLAIKIAGGGSINLQDKSFDFPSRGMLNIDKARNDFGYDPKTDIEVGFQRYYDWLKNENTISRS